MCTPRELLGEELGFRVRVRVRVRVRISVSVRVGVMSYARTGKG